MLNRATRLINKKTIRRSLVHLDVPLTSKRAFSFFFNLAHFPNKGRFVRRIAKDVLKEGRVRSDGVETDSLESQPQLASWITWSVRLEFNLGSNGKSRRSTPLRDRLYMYQAPLNKCFICKSSSGYMLNPPISPQSKWICWFYHNVFLHTISQNTFTTDGWSL